MHSQSKYLLLLVNPTTQYIDAIHKHGVKNASAFGWRRKLQAMTNDKQDTLALLVKKSALQTHNHPFMKQSWTELFNLAFQDHVMRTVSHTIIWANAPSFINSSDHFKINTVNHIALDAEVKSLDHTKAFQLMENHTLSLAFPTPQLINTLCQGFSWQQKQDELADVALAYISTLKPAGGQKNRPSSINRHQKICHALFEAIVEEATSRYHLPRPEKHQRIKTQQRLFKGDEEMVILYQNPIPTNALFMLPNPSDVFWASLKHNEPSKAASVDT